MFKKIHSDRDPRDTVISEIKKEFKPYFSKARHSLKGTAERYPKFLFGMMVINITLSVILCFTVFRHREPPPQKALPVKLAAPVSGGLDRIIRAGAALQQTIRLKKQVDSITRKKTLTPADSAALLKDLDSLQRIHRTINF
jgi:hypothetical protein